MTTQAVHVVVAPYNSVIASAATQLQIPYVSLTVDNPRQRDASNVLIDTMPSFTDLAQLFVHLAINNSWGKVAVIYDDGEMGKRTFYFSSRRRLHDNKKRSRMIENMEACACSHEIHAECSHAIKARSV